MSNVAIATAVGTFWFLLPAAFANMAPVIIRRIKIWGLSVDFGQYFFGKRIFGDNKTWRGIVTGVIVATGVLYLQQLAYPFAPGRDILNYSSINVLYWGLLLGGGALLGDLFKSFIKRRMGIPPGASWPVADQIDWILGALVASSFAIVLSFHIWIVGAIMFGALHPIANRISYWLGLQKNKY